MTSTTNAAARRPATALLNSLITACNDGARAQRAASAIVGGNERRARLEDSAGRRLTFATELRELVRGLGGTPPEGGSTSETVRAAMHWFDVLLVGDNGGDAYSSCARIEANAVRLYEKAIHANLPGRAGLVVARHHAEVLSDHAELRRLSMGG